MAFTVSSPASGGFPGYVRRNRLRKDIALVRPLSGAGLAMVHRWASLGQVRSGVSLPPGYQTGFPSLPASPGSATAYPVT